MRVVSGVQLRSYQADALDLVRASYGRRRRSPLLVMATGAGKTVTFAAIVEGAVRRGKRVLIVAHRRELIRQASRKLTDAAVTHGIIAPGHTATRDPVQVASVQTVARRLDTLPSFDLIVIDEAHHAVAGSYSVLIAAQPGARLLGVTATPERMDGRGLGIEAGGPFDDLILGPDVAQLVTEGYLTPSRVLAPGEAPDLSGVRTRGGDYEAAALEAAMGGPTLTGCAVQHYRQHAEGLPAIAFCVSVQHARDVAATFCKAGYRAVAADGSTPTPERDAAISGLGTGAVQVLCACDLISEGLDVPAVSAVILLRPTKSLGLHMQHVGRGLRPAPGKAHLTVLDHAGNTLAHGLPDTPREWSLLGRAKGAQREASGWRCPACFLVQVPAKACRECGEAAPWLGDGDEREGRSLRLVEGQLQVVDPERIARLRATPLSKLLADNPGREQLREIAQARGYKSGWVWHTMQNQQRASAGDAA